MKHTADRDFYPVHLNFMFKKVFGNPEHANLLAAFLRAALDISEDEFDKLVFADTFVPGDAPGDKESILDVRVHTVSGHVIDVEMQLAAERDLRNRILQYASKLVSGQLKAGDDYGKMRRAVSIIICLEDLLKEETSYYNSYRVLNRASGKEFSDLLEIDVLEPGKLPKENDGRLLYSWAQLFRAEEKEEYAMIAEKTPVKEVHETVGVLMEMNEEEREQLRKEAHDKWVWDREIFRKAGYDRGHAEGLEVGLFEGMNKGLAEGRIEGMQQGLEQGRTEGMAESSLGIARAMKTSGYAVEEIAKLTGLSLEVIKSL